MIICSRDIDVTRAFGLTVAGHEANVDDNSDGDQNPLLEKQRSSTRICSSSKEANAGKKEDDHNEVCEVCERGGDLLCCDTCSLVFHVACIRQKIASIPKGKWSCAHCVADVSCSICIVLPSVISVVMSVISHCNTFL